MHDAPTKTKCFLNILEKQTCIFGSSHITSCQVRSFQLFKLDFVQWPWCTAMPSRFTEYLLAVFGCMHVFNGFAPCTPCPRANYTHTILRSSIVALWKTPDTMALENNVVRTENNQACFDVLLPMHICIESFFKKCTLCKSIYTQLRVNH